jgi:hypothetical protein
MTIIITLFYLSLVIIIAMVGWKLVSLRALKLSLVPGVEKELHGKLYEALHTGWHMFRVQVLARARKFALSVFYMIAHEVLRYTIIIGRKFGARFHRWFDMVKGKGEIHKKGSVSFFLRDIAEHKESLKSESPKS